jgi:RNA polymerase sigma-70 factor, ECF subfamily
MLTKIQVVSDRRSWLLDRAQYLCGTQADAEDLVQETFLRFTSRFPEDSALPEEWPCAAWLLSTMTHCYYDQCRRQRVRERCATDLLLGEDIQESPELAELAPSELVSSEQLGWALQQLSDRTRSAVSLYLEGRKNPEIARELGISPGAVAKRLHDARVRLRRALRPVLH